MWPTFSKIFATARSRNWAVDAAGALVLLAALLLLRQGLYAPWGRDLDDRLQRMEELEAQIVGSDEVAQKHQHLQARLGALRTAGQQARRRMPPLTSGNDFVEQATQIAKAIGLEVVQCAAGIPQITPTHSTVDVACRINGSFASICRFLAAIDQLPQIATVSRFDLETATNSEAYPIQLTFQLYYQADLHDTKRKREAP